MNFHHAKLGIKAFILGFVFSSLFPASEAVFASSGDLQLTKIFSPFLLALMKVKEPDEGFLLAVGFTVGVASAA